MRMLIAGLVALGVTGCATGPGGAIRMVEVPMPVVCAPAVALGGPYPDTAAAIRSAPDLFERTKLLLAGRALRDADLGVLAAALRGCGAEIGGAP